MIVTRIALALMAAGLMWMSVAGWREELPKHRIPQGRGIINVFTANDSHNSRFRKILIEGKSLLVGGRNKVYNLNLTNISMVQNTIDWDVPEEKRKMCTVKGKDEEECQNYIRVLLARKNPDKFLVCGTHAYKPLCRNYTLNGDQFVMEFERSGQAVCPYDPLQNSTAVFLDNDVYSGTVADFSGTDPLIYREPLQTEQFDASSLDDPDFVHSTAHEHFVYMFFRETAVEHINCGKIVFSRVARLCKYDRGGPHRFRNRWTTFLKSRLNCSIPGEFPFYFNEIQSSTDFVSGEYGGVKTTLLYATFITPSNSVPGSAVCAFSFRDIDDTFNGNFKNQVEFNSNWLPVEPSEVPNPRPGICHANMTNEIPDQNLQFIKYHKLMDEAVPAFFGEPIVIKTGFGYRFSQIAVDPQVEALDKKKYDVLYIGTDNGVILKTINANAGDSIQNVTPVIIEERKIFSPSEPIRSLKVVRSGARPQLIAVSDKQIQSLELNMCSLSKTCFQCVATRDPSCVWSKSAKRCQQIEASNTPDSFIQNISTGESFECPQDSGKDAGSVSGLSTNQPKHNDISQGRDMNIRQDGEYPNSQAEDPSVSVADTPMPAYSTETMALAVAAGAIAALAVGFVAGYFCGRKCHKDEDDNLPYPDTEYEYFEQRQNINRIQAEPKLLSQVEEVTYAEPVLAPPENPLKAPHSPRSTLRKPSHPHHPHPNYPPHPGHPGHPHAETLFQFQQPDGSAGGYRRDNFGTLRSHQGDGYRRGNDGFSTTRSVKKVYL